jgi:GntR family transcriptional regulator
MEQMDINYESKVPLYYQLREEIKKKILNGTYKENDLIPSERELGEQFSLSSTTVRRALNDLVQEKLLERKAGKGTFVRMSKVKRDLRKVLGFTANMQEMGLSPSTRVLSKKIVSANAFARQRLGLEKGAMVVKINRLRLANDVPMMLETRYIRTDLCPGIEKLDLSTSLWKVFQNIYSHKPYRHTQNVTIAKFSGPQAALFGLEGGAQAFLINGVTYIKDGQPIECEESLYRSDKYDLAFEAFLEE